MNYTYMISLYDIYINMFDDLYFQKMFDKDSQKNLEYKIDILEWSIENNKIATQHEKLDEDIFYENYPEEQSHWDL